MIDAITAVETTGVPNADVSNAPRSIFAILRAALTVIFTLLADVPRLGPFSKLLEFYEQTSSGMLQALETEQQLTDDITRIVQNVRAMSRELGPIDVFVEQAIAASPVRADALALIALGTALPQAQVERYNKDLREAVVAHRRLLGDLTDQLRLQRRALSDIEGLVLKDLDKLPVRARELVEDGILKPGVVEVIALRVDEAKAEIVQSFVEMRRHVHVEQRKLERALQDSAPGGR